MQKLSDCHVLWCRPGNPAVQKAEVGRWQVQERPAQAVRLSQNKRQRAGNVAQCFLTHSKSWVHTAKQKTTKKNLSDQWKLDC